MSTPIDILERRQLRDGIPQFKAGDTVRVHFQVIEGQRRRVQVFEGIVIIRGSTRRASSGSRRPQRRCRRTAKVRVDGRFEPDDASPWTDDLVDRRQGLPSETKPAVDAEAP